MKKELWYDVLVIGGGGAALRAALSADRAGANTAVLCKKTAGKSGATYYSVAEVGAFNVPDGAMDSSDSPDAFYQDMMEASLDMAKPELCRYLADHAEDAMNDLEEISNGQVFSKLKDGSFNVYQACFSTKPRSHVIENHFKPILKALREELANTGVTVLDSLQAVDLLVGDGQVGGVIAIDEKGELLVIHAKSVIMAAGGASRLFHRNMYPADITGDSYAMAYRAGAELANMEFIQAGIGVAYPFINLFGNYLWKAYPHIRNATGEDILLKYGGSEEKEHQAITEKTHFPFSTRDTSQLIEIAVQSEINKGNCTENGNVYLDFLSTDFKKLFEEDPNFASMWKFTYDWHLQKGIDFYKDPIEIACFAHAINGGILIDEHAESSLPGLYAAGEAASGPHGADRLGGNMSVTCQVFGKLAGEQAAIRAKSMNEYVDVAAAVKETEALLSASITETDLNTDEIMNELQLASDRALLIVRSEEGLQSYLQTVHDLRKKLAEGCSKEQLPELLQLQNLLITGELIAQAALLRRESRGSHHRVDYPELDEAFGKMQILCKNNTTTE